MRNRVAATLTILAALAAATAPVLWVVAGSRFLAVLWMVALTLTAVTDWGARRVLPHGVQAAVVLIAAPVAMFVTISFGGLVFAPAVLAIVLAHAIRTNHPRLWVPAPIPEIVRRIGN